jgi:hypothetical protein
MWISEKPDASALLEAWASDIRRLTSTEAPFTIDGSFKRSSTQELLLVHSTRSRQEPPVRHGPVEGHQ